MFCPYIFRGFYDSADEWLAALHFRLSHYGCVFGLADAFRVGAENKKGSDCSEPFLILILAVTYVPASFPAQYHRPGKA
jgi:hypothetical protein